MKGKKERGRPPAVPSCQQLQKVLKTFGDANHARVYPVTEPPGSKGPDQEPQSVPVLFVTDFKDGWPSQRGVCQDKIYLSVLPRPDADLPFLKQLIKVIEYLPSSPTRSVTSSWLPERNMRLPMDRPRGDCCRRKYYLVLPLLWLSALITVINNMF